MNDYYNEYISHALGWVAEQLNNCEQFALLARWSIREKLNRVSSVQLRRSVRAFTLVCSTLIVATGMWQPIKPHIEGEQYLEDYETVSTDSADFEAQTVLILGQQ